jgi:hypothetical protein
MIHWKPWILEEGQRYTRRHGAIPIEEVLR